MLVIHFESHRELELTQTANTHKVLTKILKYLCKSDSVSPDPHDLRNKATMKMSVK